MVDIAVKDYRRKPRYYVLKQDAVSDEFLPEPSPINWREVKREGFVSEAITVFIKRSK